MIINSDINVLGSIPDFELVNLYLKLIDSSVSENELIEGYQKIRTDKSIKRFGKAISSTFLSFQNNKIKELVVEVLSNEGISNQSLWVLFWNSAINNNLFNYLNNKVFFPAFYSGRLILRQDEIAHCLKELKQSEKDLQKWSDSTLEVTASKYLTLLKKFNLLEGKVSKSIRHPFLEDKEFILLVYFILAVETKSNLLKSPWIEYSLSETKYFIERVLDKRYSKYFEVNYSGDKLRLQPLIDYKELYYVINQSHTNHESN